MFRGLWWILLACVLVVVMGAGVVIMILSISINFRSRDENEYVTKSIRKRYLIPISAGMFLVGLVILSLPFAVITYSVLDFMATF